MNMKTYIIAILCLLAGSMSAQKKHTLENEKVRAVFDLSNGALLQLENKQTHWNILTDERQGKSFDMFLSLKDAGTCHVDGMTQPTPKVNVSADNITFTWETINTGSNGDALPVTFIGTVKLGENGLEYGGEIVNRSGYMVEQLSWPFIGEVTAPDANDRLLLQYLNYTKLDAVELYPRLSSTYSGWCKLPEASFALINNEKQGLYFSSLDKNADELIHCFYEILPGETFGADCGTALSKKDDGERKQMKLQIKARRMIYNQPMMNTALVPVVLQPYEGSWHKGADIYKEWRKTWFVAPHRPDWVKRVNSWQQLQINGSEDNLNFKYKDLVKYAEDCKHYGVDAIQFTGWTLGGQDRGLPSHDVDPRLGTREDLKKAIAESNKLGVKILLFTKFTWAEMSTDYYDQFKDYVALDIHKDSCWHPGYNYYTYTQLSGINTRRFGVFCMMSDDLRAALDKEFAKCLDLGAQGMVYDENQHHAGHMFCFNPKHGHKVPGFIYQGADLLGRGFYDMTRKSSPEFLMVGEGCYDLQAQYYSTYTRADYRHTAGQRYVDPELPVACAVINHNDRNTINMCLMDRYAISYEPRNFKGSLSEYPRVMAYGKKVDDLRRKYSDYVWDAEFRDIQGATVKGKDVRYSVFVRKSDGKRAVVVMNYNTTSPTTATVSLEGRTGSLVVATPENSKASGFGGSVKLQPQSVAVIMEK